MKRFFSLIFSLLLIYAAFANPAIAKEYSPTSEEAGTTGSFICSFSKMFITVEADSCEQIEDPCLQEACSNSQNQRKFIAGGLPKNPTTGQINSPGVLGYQGKVITMAFQNQPSSREYIADILNNIGVPSVSSTHAQGTGYTAMEPFLPIWKVFRNLAYSLYIIMFIVIGVMIMLRTKVNAQTIISIQSALPNLLITLILITFSYAIVGFMIDIMYFLIYFVVYLAQSAGLINAPTKAISRIMDYSAWSIIFEGRNSLISAVADSIDDVLYGLGNGIIGIAGKAISLFSPTYLIVAVWLAVAMFKLMFILIKSYIMIIVQVITAPVQILLNAMPGSKAFSEWLKKTASYLIPYPIVGAMIIFAAVLIGDPSKAVIFKDVSGSGDLNPFGVNTTALPNDKGVWLPPFTLTNSNLAAQDLMILIGFFVFTMTPTAAKMAQDWMQVKDSPYTSEIGAGLGGAWQIAQAPIGTFRGWKAQAEQRNLLQQQSKWIGEEISRPQTTRKT